MNTCEQRNTLFDFRSTLIEYIRKQKQNNNTLYTVPYALHYYSLKIISFARAHTYVPIYLLSNSFVKTEMEIKKKRLIVTISTIYMSKENKKLCIAIKTDNKNR